MLEFLNLIRDFFSTLLSGNQKDAKKRRELKKIYRELKNSNQHYFKQSTNEVLPDFAVIVHKFAQYARSLNGLFERTIFNENIQLAEKYKDSLIEAGLDEENRQIKDNFQFEIMRNRLASSRSFQETLLGISKEFQVYLDFFRQPEFAEFDKEYTQLDRLAAVCRHDFDKLLSFFDPGIHVDNHNQKPNFAPAHGKHLTQDLMDVYYILAELDISQGVTKNIIQLYIRFRKESTLQDIDKLKKIVGNLDSIHKQHLSSETLLSLLKAVSEDPALSIPTDHEVRTCLELYKSKLLSRFELDREKLTREYSEQAVLSDLHNLFGDTALHEIRGYTENISNELLHEGFVNYTHIRPFQIVKSFIVLFFEKSIKEHVKLLVIDAFFENKNFKDRFISLFHDAQEASENIITLENTLIEKGEVSSIAVNDYLEKHKNGKSVSVSLTKLVETINDNIYRLMEHITITFSEFTSVLGELLGDARQHSPTIVNNIKVIAGERNQEFLRRLTDDHGKMAKFIDIMKNFTIIRKNIPHKSGTP